MRNSGKIGEDFAALTLARQGFAVLERNVYSRYGEVDIVAVKGDTICFIEVKTRRRGAAVSGAQALGISKQRKILRTALLYLQDHPEHDLQPRFDLFTVETDGKGNILSHEYLEGAFDDEAQKNN